MFEGVVLLIYVGAAIYAYHHFIDTENIVTIATAVMITFAIIFGLSILLTKVGIKKDRPAFLIFQICMQVGLAMVL